MPKKLPTIGLSALFLLLSGPPANPCGDKLLILGSGVRFQLNTAEYPALILLYMKGTTPGSTAVGDSKLQSFLRQAGHRLQSATSEQEVAEALKTGRYDLVLADFADAPALEQMVAAASSQPLLLPFIFKGTKAELSEAKRRYRCVLKAPIKPPYFLATLDKAMELKQSRVKSLRPTAE
jgi:CheY-like chemotaxis protein